MKVIITCFILLVSQLAAGQKIQSLLDSLRLKSGYPGIVFSYVNDDGPQSLASGWADVEAQEEMTINHRLHGGSTGKTVVSTLVMQLVEQEKLTIDDPVKKYLGSYSWYDQLPNSEEIAIRNLLQHTSGIIRYEFKEAFLDDLSKSPDKVWKPEELISYVLGDEPQFEAGKGFTYADTNYILLGMIIEKITGGSFFELAENRVLKPLNIKTFTPTYSKVIPNMAQGYYEEGTAYALGFKAPFLVKGVAQNNMQFEWTGGGYAYETSDYARLLKKVYEGEAFNMDVVGDQLFDFVDAPEIRSEYGMGVMRFDFPGIGEVIGHGGFFPGYNTIGLYHIESKTAFAMQINSTEQAHLRQFFGDFLQLVKFTLDAN